MRQKLIPALCNLFGTLILLLVIALCGPMTVPRLFGYEIYHVVSGSMEPEIPVGSLIYVEGADPEKISEGEVIAFRSGSTVVVHRVMQNKVVEGEFVTKGDANAAEDRNTIPYAQLNGRVIYHFPWAGQLLSLYASPVGKVYLVLFAACGAMLNMLAGRLRKNYGKVD